MSRYKIAILGGGPGGYVAAIRAAQLGAETVLIEAGELGGVCLNEGCIPTKTLLKSARVYQELLSSEKFGISIDGEVRIDWAAMQRRKDGVVGQLNSGVRGLLKQNGVEVVQGFGEVLDPHTIVVGGERISADHLIIATGSSPAILPIPGLQEALESGAAVTSTGALTFKEVPQRLVIVGGGVVGMEFAALFSSLGSQVTVLEKFTVLGSLDQDLQKYMQRLLEKKGVEIHNGADIQRFAGSQVIAEINGETREFQGDAVLVSLGRRPNVQAVSRLGLELERGAIRTNERLETSIPGVYAIGDVNGKQMLAHTASAEGLAAVEHHGRQCGHQLRQDTCLHLHLPRSGHGGPHGAGGGAARTQGCHRHLPWPPTAGRGGRRAEGSSRSLLTRSTVRCWVCTSSLPRPPT